jgi:hypothetical protein
MNNDYITRSQIERIGLMLLFNRIYKGVENTDYYKGYTPEEGFDCYDGCGGNMKEGSIINRQIYEVKVRDTHYPELMLEVKKLNDLTKKAKEFEATAYYVSITPSGCYVFKLKEKNAYFWIKKQMPVSTVDPSRGKINKEFTLLDCKDAKFFPSITSNSVKSKHSFIQTNKRVSDLVKQEQCKECKGLNFLFEKN